MRRRRSATPQAASLEGRDIAVENAGGELIGDLDGPLAVVDRAGTVALAGVRWRIAWAVGAEDRWHIAGREAAVRSRLVDDMPVAETAMRVPGGDVVQRVSAVRDRSGRGLLLAFENQSPGPVSLALAVIQNDTGRRGANVGRPRRRRHPALVEVRGSRLMVDGQVALDLGRRPGGAVAVADGGVWTAVAAGPDSGDCRSRSRSGRAAAAAVVPLVPRAPMRATVPLCGGPDQGAARGEAASGWLTVVARAAAVSLPDETAMRAWRRGIAGSILVAGSNGVLSRSDCSKPRARRRNRHNGTVVPAVRMARTAVVLDRVGLPDEADRARGPLLEAAEASRLSGEEAGAALLALSSRRLRSGRASELAHLAGPLAHQAGGSLQPHTLEQVAAALDTEAPGAARDAREMLRDLEVRSPRASCRNEGDAVVESAVERAVEGAGHEAARPVFTGSANRGALLNLAGILRRSVAFGGDGLDGVEALVDCLVAEAPDHLTIAPLLPDEWIGAPVDAHGLLTRHGTLSFSVRWHGTRPALLWELQPARAGNPATRIRCGLDDSWQTGTPAGEALLEPVD